MNTNPKGEIHNLFPTPLVKTNIGRDFTKDEIQLLLSDILMWRDKDDKGMTNHRSNDTYLFDNFAGELNDIKKFCEQQLNIYLKEIEGIDTNLATLRITQSWLNKTNPGESHHAHSHGNSYLSGVLYISCLPNDSIIISSRASTMFNNLQFKINKVTQWNGLYHKQSVVKGDLIIFPSWVPHEVFPNETKNKERISLSFNTFPIGEMGEYSGNHLKL
jgi:uncharacterized protein (TIGR02466 family)